MNLKSTILTTFLLIFLTKLSFASVINQATAEYVGRKFYYEHQYQKNQIDFQSIQISSCRIHSSESKILFYEFGIIPKGFVLVAADDASIPVLGYSLEDYSMQENLQSNINDWIENYKIQMLQIINEKLLPNQEISSQWNHLQNNKFEFFSGKSIDPLLISKWNQDAKYNASCPADQDGPGGNVYAGCVAVAMAQVMNYYKYPIQGNGNYSYYESTYGTQYVNYGTTNYDWNSMVNYIGAYQNPQIAQLLYHCGVSVDMMYSPTGSGAYTDDCVSAFINYFKYKNTCSISYKSSMSASQWTTKLIQNLDAKMPLVYSGNPSSGAGHAFNCDGYQGSDYFHFNWGWSGNYDGYFYVNNLNPASYNFNFSQKAIFNIFPNVNYPYNCSGQKTLTNFEGVVYDGSGPVNYQNNNDCQWLIKPGVLIDHIILSFDRFETESNNDLVLIYDGSDTNSAILASFSGLSLPSNIASTGNAMLVRFITNSNTVMSGFSASYKSVFPVFCQGTKYLSDSSGIFDDGSGMNAYQNSIVCKWYINPPNAQSVKLEFSSFRTEALKDYVKIYNPATTPSTLLGEYSGTNLPPVIISPSGFMMVVFTANSDINDSGWTAKYSTITDGMIDINDYKVKLLPNPSNSGKFNLTFSESQNLKTHILIFSSNGLKIKEYEKEINGFYETIDLASFSNGVYYITIENSEIRYTTRAVIIK